MGSYSIVDRSGQRILCVQCRVGVFLKSRAFRPMNLVNAGDVSHLFVGMSPPVLRFIQTWFINTFAVLVAVYAVPGLRFKNDNLWTPFVTSLVLGILNAFFRPVMMFLALPLLIVTLGLFMLIINALLLYLTGLLLGSYFEVDGFGSAVLGALIISVVSVTLNILTGANRSRIRIERRRPPSPGPGDGGPIIDV
jgi:putative membrane protein